MALKSIFKRKAVQGERQLIAQTAPKSPVTEQYRNIRTNIQFAAVGASLRSVVVTSANPAEGKTTTTANLAVVFAQQGQRVLLVDADLRKPALHTVLKEKNLQGLTSVLAGQKTLQACIRKTAADNLSFLPSGPVPPNPAEMLGSPKMKDILQELQEKFDLIIFDTPPALAVTDAQVLANICDGSILVVRSGQTDRESAQKATALLQSTSARLLGGILNDQEQKGQDYYYYYGK